MKNEIMGLNNTTLNNTNRVQRVDDMGCKFRHWMVYYLKNLEKEIQSGDLYARNGRILHASRNSQISQDRRGLCYPSSSTEKNARVQIGRFLESQQKRISRVPSQQEEYSRQKIKPPERWQTKQFTAVRFLPSVFQAVGRNPWNNLPTFSIALLSNQSQWLCDMWAHERKKVCS